MNLIIRPSDQKHLFSKTFTVISITSFRTCITRSTGCKVTRYPHTETRWCDVTNISPVLPRISICFSFVIEVFEKTSLLIVKYRKDRLSSLTLPANLNGFSVNISEHQWEHRMSSHCQNVSINFKFSLILQGLLERNIPFPFSNFYLLKQK